MIAQESEFYVAGGTLEPDAPCYVERQADTDLFTHLARGEFCYVLTSRQMGKSSLMARTAARLRHRGIAVVLLELTALGQNLTAEQWYDGLLGHIGEELELEAELEQFWLTHARLSPLQRWLRALREVVLPGLVEGRELRVERADGPNSQLSTVNSQLGPRLVICLDEIDAVRSLPFSTDEFFAGIRECYNRRSEDPAFHRLTFCLLGVFTPSDLIQDTRTTPFNIGRRIELNDFREGEAAALAQGLGREPALGAALLRRVLYWTGGHPYLTQRLCRAVAEKLRDEGRERRDESGPAAPDPSSFIPHPSLVDRLCAELFLSHGARERDDNLLFVRERLLRSEADLASLLTLYGQVRSGKRVRDDETNPLVSILRLSGIVRPTESGSLRSSAPPLLRSSAVLQVRNRIYAHVFDLGWVRANMPDAELRRQRAAFRKGLVRSGAVACAVVGLVGALALSAIQERNRMSRLLYAADMNLAQQAVSERNYERAEELLDEHRPRGPGEADLRGFEWRYLWQLCQQDALYTFPAIAGTVWGVAYSPDGKTLAASYGDGTVRLYDVATRRATATLTTGVRGKGADGAGVGSPPLLALQGPRNRASTGSVAFSPDGKIVAANGFASGVTGGGAWLWDVATKREIAAIRGFPNGPLAFSPDGKLLAAEGWDGSNTAGVSLVKLWDVDARRMMAVLGPPRPLYGVAFSPDGKTLATAAGKWPVELWSVAGPRKVGLLAPPPGDWVQAVAFSPGGKNLAMCRDDGTVRLWNRTTRRVVATLPGRYPHEASGGGPCIAFSPSGKMLATASDVSTTVTLWDLVARKEIKTFRGHKQGVNTLAFSPDEASNTLASASTDGTIKLWSATPRREGTAIGQLKSELRSVAFAPNSRLLATGNADGTVTLWSAASGPALVTLPAHSGPVLCVAFSPDGSFLASAGGDRLLKLWNVTSLQRWQATRRRGMAGTLTCPLVATLRGHKDRVWCVGFSPDGRILASGSEDGAVKLWNPAAGRPIATLQTGAEAVFSLSFSPDGRTLALGTNENSVKLWDLPSRQEVAALPAHQSSVTATAFSPDGTILASGSADHTIILWDVATRQPLGPPLKGCEGRINAVAFSPDGKTLASGSADAKVRLWNVATGREVGIPRGAQGAVASVAFAPDGGGLAAVGADGAVRLWRAPAFAITDAHPVSAPLPASPP